MPVVDPDDNIPESTLADTDESPEERGRIGYGRNERASSWLLGAVLILLVFIIHVFAAIWTRGTLSAMTTGNVSGGWAWRHHRKWLRELAGRQKVDPAE